MKVKALFAEFIGTFTLVFVCVGVIAADKMMNGTVGLLGIALAQGLSIACLASALGATSGGHCNPAITLGLLLGRKIDFTNAVAYWVAQFAGAAVGALAANFAFDGAALMATSHGMPVTLESVSQTRAMFLEAMATFFLVMTVYGTAVDSRAPKVGAWLIGVSITMGVLITGPLTGGALNTARWFGPALVSGQMGQAVIYIVGPLVGGALAGILYPLLFSEEPAKPVEA